MACLQHVRDSWTKFFHPAGLDHDINTLGGDINVLEAWPGHVKVSVIVKQKHLNGGGNTHGGLIMTLVDDVTWLALQTLGAPVIHTVSTNLSAEFVRPCGKVGDELIIVGEAVKKGKRIGFLRVTFYLNDEICAYGSQTVAIHPGTPQLTQTFSPDGGRAVPVQEVKSRL